MLDCDGVDPRLKDVTNSLVSNCMIRNELIARKQ